MTQVKTVSHPVRWLRDSCAALEVGHKTARAVLSVLKKQKPENQLHLARVGRQPVTIPKNKMVVVQCGRLNKSVVSASHVVLEPNLETPWPSGLAIREQLIELPSEDNGKIEVTVENVTDNDIVLPSRTTLGLLHSVVNILPFHFISFIRIPISCSHSNSYSSWGPPQNTTLYTLQYTFIKTNKQTKIRWQQQ